MVTTTVHRPKHIGRIIKNRESELTHALLKTRLARRSVVLPVKMNVGHCPALGAFFFAQIGSAMSFFDRSRRGVGWNWGGVVSGVFNLESPGVEAPGWKPRHERRYHAFNDCAA